MFKKLDYRYIYVLGNWSHPFRYKIGIARDVDKRKAGINRSLNGGTYDLFWIKVIYAQKMEHLLHGIYSPLSAKMKGSGKTEWFWMIFPVTPILLLILIWLIQVCLIPALIIGMIYALLNGMNF